MLSLRPTWLVLIVVCAACMGGQPPPPPTRAVTTAAPSAAPAAETLEPTGDFAPATAPPAGVTVAPALEVTTGVTPTTVVGLITPGTAVSLTQLALVETGKADQAAWSPGGDLLGAAGASGVSLYDTTTLSLTETLPIGQWATSLAFDRAGDTLAVGTVGAIVQVWNLERLEPTTLLLGPGVQVSHVAYSPAGPAVLASLGVDNKAHLWYVDGQQYLRGLGAGLRPATALAFSPDGEWLATAEAERVLLWDVELAMAFSDPVARNLLAPASRRGAVTAVTFSPTGRQLAASNTTGTIELWSTAGTQPRLILARLNTPALRLAYSPDGALLASAHQDRGIRLWNTTDGALLATLTGHTDLVTGVAFSPDGTRLASSSWDGTVRLWGLAPP